MAAILSASVRLVPSGFAVGGRVYRGEQVRSLEDFQGESTETR